MKSILVKLLHVFILLVGIHTFDVNRYQPSYTSSRHRVGLLMKQDDPLPSSAGQSSSLALFQQMGRAALSSAAGLLLLGNVMNNQPALAAPDIAPPSLQQQIPQMLQTKQAPKALQTSAVQRWSYSVFLDHVEKNEVEKVTFSPDGKRAVGVDSDGDRFSVDIPNDPNLLSFLVQHKVDINVAPINNNNNGGFGGLGGNGGGAGGAGETAVVIPDSPLEKQLQSLILPGLINLGLFAIPAIQLFIPSNSTVELAKKRQKEVFRNSFGAGGGRAGGRPGQGGFLGGFLNRLGGPGGRGGPNGGPMNMVKGRAKIQVTPKTGVKFRDVAGCDSAKEALTEVVDFLKNPTAYTDMGAKIPKGVLLAGPPGTGKTLLAKAVAGEAGVPFITSSGSEFIQVFVGVGAARVRELFAQARKYAPCIIFLDEIDAIGKARGGRGGGGNDEREQTLNQILVEMDGFAKNNGIIVVAATNRPDVLDPAITRPGRFDRKVVVPLPEFKGRVAILKVHARGKKFAPDIDLEQVARRTPGLSGASLKSVLNEASLHASTAGKKQIEWEDIDWAIDRVTIGMEMSNEDSMVRDMELVAFHEAGHAIVGGLIPEFDTVTKISIVPRSNGAGGLTFFSPLEDRLDDLVTKHFLESQLAVAWGGRVAEELIYGPEKITGGASSDLKQISRVARAMVYNLGMSRLPPINYDTGRSFRQQNGFSWNPSPALKKKLKAEVIRLISNGYATAKRILLENQPAMYELARRLLQDEQVSQEEFHFLLYEYKAKTIPYGLYGESKVDEMPYSIEIEEAMDEALEIFPSLVKLLPQEEELVDGAVVKQLPAVKQELEEKEVNVLEDFPVDLLMDDDFGKTKRELLIEAKRTQASESRKQKLLKLLEEEEKLLAKKKTSGSGSSSGGAKKGSGTAKRGAGAKKVTIEAEGITN